MRFLAKLALPLIVSSILLPRRAQAALRGSGRGLATVGYNYSEFTFLVSENYYLPNDTDTRTDLWCITATNGVAPGAKVGFRKCNFGAPDTQLWKYDNNQGKFRSRIDSNRCLNVNKNLSNGPIVRMQDCNGDHGLDEFEFDGYYNIDNVEPKVSMIRVKNSTYCLTNKGLTPEPTDTIKAVKCNRNQDRFWWYQWESLTKAHILYNYDAPMENNTDSNCLGVQDEKAIPGQSLVLQAVL